MHKIQPSFIAVIFIVICFVIGYLFIFNPHTPPDGYDLQIMSYDDYTEKTDSSPNLSMEQNISADLVIVLPSGKLSIETSLVQEQAPFYGWSSNSFYVSGQNIKKVTYELKNGTISYFDETREKEMQEDNGHSTTIDIFLSYSALGIAKENFASRSEISNLYDSALKQFEKLWENETCPELEKAKIDFFSGLSLNFEDYDVSYYPGGFYPIRTEEEGMSFRFVDKLLHEELTSEGHQVTVFYSHENFESDYLDSKFGVFWNPYIPNLSKLRSFEQLPKDELIVTIEMNNGDVLERTIQLSFNKYGYCVAKLK